jgi:hypothetical protein
MFLKIFHPQFIISICGWVSPIQATLSLVELEFFLVFELLYFHQNKIIVGKYGYHCFPDEQNKSKRPVYFLKLVMFAGTAEHYTESHNLATNLHTELNSNSE